MESNAIIDILKQAILLEKRGYSFYNAIAKQSADKDVITFFEFMANDEENHIAFLSRQFKKYTSEKKFDVSDITPDIQLADTVLTNSLKNKIQAAGFEAAAVAAAIDMEKRAILAYSERAKNAQTEEEQKFYKWLADWEEGHLKMLTEIDNEIKEKVWNDNNFWPF